MGRWMMNRWMAGWVSFVGQMDGWNSCDLKEKAAVFPQSLKSTQTLLILYLPECPIQCLANVNPARPSVLILPHFQENRMFHPQVCLLLLYTLLATFTSSLHASVSFFVKRRWKQYLLHRVVVRIHNRWRSFSNVLNILYILNKY